MTDLYVGEVIISRSWIFHYLYTWLNTRYVYISSVLKAKWIIWRKQLSWNYSFYWAIQ